MKTVKNLINNVIDEMALLNANNYLDKKPFIEELSSKTQWILLLISTPILILIAVVVDFYKILKRSSK